MTMTTQQAVDAAGRKSARFDHYARQRDNNIIAMDANGCTAREIAEELSLHPATVLRVLRESGK